MNNRTSRPPAPRRTPRRILRPLQARAAARGEEIESYEEESEPNMKFSHALIVVLILHVLAVGGVFAFNILKTSHTVPGKQKSPVAEKQEAAAQAASNPAQAAGKTEAKLPVPTIAHTVAAGDTLKKIAAQHKTTVEAIAQGNGLEVSAILHIGQVLQVKTSAKSAAQKESAPAASNSEAKTAKAAPAAAAKAPASPDPKPAAAAKAAANPDPKPAAATKAAASPDPKPAAATKAAASPTAQEHSSQGSYTVAKGDNPYSIAKKLKVSYNELLKANKVEDPTKLQIGQKLIIP